MTDNRDLRTPLCDLLGCRHPILQAGMGGVAKAELVAAVSNAGAYGFLGMVREPPELISREIDTVRESTDQPFGVNLIPAATNPSLLEEQMKVCFDKQVHSMCFFWDVDQEAVAQAKQAGCVVLYQVGSVRDAVAAESAGADIIIAQGFEAGGHVRGIVSSLVLLPQVVGAVSIPVVASGGFASGDALMAAFALGAQGIHCGTVFLATEESFAHEFHKRKVIASNSEDTVYTDVFAINWPPGSPVRTIHNSLTRELGKNLLGHKPDELPRQVIAKEEARPIYRFSTDSPLRTTTGDLEALPSFAGQITGLIKTTPKAAGLVSEMVQSANRSLDRLQWLRRGAN
ncbi:MAG: nitronate monooxygenase [Hyphomicrobiales bacterium]|nr:nitronate monooxygenase [Hyphomicrobiales bacterium]